MFAQRSRYGRRVAHVGLDQLHAAAGDLLQAPQYLTPAVAQVAIKGRILHTVAGPAIKDGVVLVENGKIKAIGPASSINIPSGWKTLEAAVVTPGLIDAHGTVGLSGLLNGKDQAHDQEQLEGSSPIQPELRAIDAYNPLDPLVPYLRSFGVTTVHTGHAPGETVSGGTIVVKLHGTTVEDSKGDARRRSR